MLIIKIFKNKIYIFNNKLLLKIKLNLNIFINFGIELNIIYYIIINTF